MLCLSWRKAVFEERSHVQDGQVDLKGESRKKWDRKLSINKRSAIKNSLQKVIKMREFRLKKKNKMKLPGITWK